MMHRPTPTDAVPRRRGRAGWALLGAKALAFLLVLTFVGRELTKQFSSFSVTSLRWRPGWVGLSVLSMVLARGLSVATLRCLLAAAGLPLSWEAMVPAAWIPPLGKYVPGKIASVGGAVWLLHRQGVSSPIAVSTIFLLNALMAQTVEILAERGDDPDIWISYHVPEGDAHNRLMVEKYRSRVPHLYPVP